MRSDDLVPLLAQQPAPAVGFRQGTVVAWNPITAENTVDVGGATLTNLPILNTAEAGILSPGDVVALLTTGQGAQSWWIVGRVTIPNTPQAGTALSAWAARGKLATATGSITVNSTTFGDAADGNGPVISGFLVGASGQALLWITAVQATPDAAAATFGVKEIYMGFDLSGPTSLSASVDRAFEVGVVWSTASNAAIGASSCASRLVPLQGLTPGSYAITAQYRIGGSGDATVSQRVLFAVPL